MGREESAKKCVEDLLKDLEKIKTNYIDKKDYKIAKEKWLECIIQRKFYNCRRDIEELHCGQSFLIGMDLFRESLQEGNFSNASYQMIKAFGAQSKLKGGIRSSQPNRLQISRNICFNMV